MPAAGDNLRVFGGKEGGFKAVCRDYFIFPVQVKCENLVVTRHDGEQPDVGGIQRWMVHIDSDEDM